MRSHRTERQLFHYLPCCTCRWAQCVHMERLSGVNNDGSMRSAFSRLCQALPLLRSPAAPASLASDLAASRAFTSSSQPAPSSSYKWLKRAALAAPFAAGAAWILAGHDRRTRAVVAAQLPVRFIRDVACAAAVAAGQAPAVQRVLCASRCQSMHACMQASFRSAHMQAAGTRRVCRCSPLPKDK